MQKTKLPFIIAAVVIVVLIVASFVEPFTGSDIVRRFFYGAWWFRILWALLAATGTWMTFHWRLWRKPAVMLLHASFLVILGGALTSALFATEGKLVLYEGEESSMFLTDDQRVAHMDFTLRLDSFRIDRYADTGEPSGYRSHVSFIDPSSSTSSTSSPSDTAVISMNHILRYRYLRFYQQSYTPDQRGTILTVVHDPYGIGITYTGYGLLLLATILLLLPRRLKRPGPGVITVSTLALAAALVYTQRWTSASHLLPVLRSPLLGLHISVIILAYTLFLVMMVLSSVQLLRPTSSRNSSFVRRLLLPSVLFLSVGIFLGAVWANISWGNYWSWDPKEVWALITLLIYCLPLHRRSLPWFDDDHHLHLYLILAFASVLITYFGVNFILGGMHSYAA